MTKQEKEKSRVKLEAELKQYRKLAQSHRSGRQWVKEVRQALGMSVTELACRLECSRSLVYRIEAAEVHGEDSVDVLNQVARGMDCRLIYAIVPEGGKTLEETAEWLKKTPQWRTEKQEARKKKEMDALNEKLKRERWIELQKRKEAQARARRRAEEFDKMVEEWAAEEAKKAAQRKPPEEWWTARTAAKMEKHGVPGDWALKQALEQANKKAQEREDAQEGRKRAEA